MMGKIMMENEMNTETLTRPQGSEVLKQLIVLAYEPNPNDITITLSDAMGLYKALVRMELSCDIADRKLGII